MTRHAQDDVCRFARDILSVRSGEPIAVVARPEADDRRSPAVEELWESTRHRYAVEHTRLESFDGQIANEAKLRQLMLPVRAALIGRLPGSHVLAVSFKETQTARIKFEDAHKEIIELALAAAPKLRDNETTVLRSEALPFAVQLHRRHGDGGAHVAVHSLIEGDGDDLRVLRMRRALSDKCPKLMSWSRDDRTSVLILEANDIQHSNVFVAFDAFRKALSERNDQPDIVVFVETETSPMRGWLFKEGARLGDDIPMPNGRSYVDGAFDRASLVEDRDQ